MMNLRRFGWALRARGPEVAAWPERDRAAAVCLLRCDAAARTLLAEALAAEDAPAPDAAALDRVTCPVRRALAPLSPFMRGIRWGAFAACLGAGLYLGVVTADVDSVADLQALLHPTMPATVLAALEN
jgi:hypothetical protein